VPGLSLDHVAMPPTKVTRAVKKVAATMPDGMANNLNAHHKDSPLQRQSQRLRETKLRKREQAAQAAELAVRKSVKKKTKRDRWKANKAKKEEAIKRAIQDTDHVEGEAKPKSKPAKKRRTQSVFT